MLAEFFTCGDMSLICWNMASIEPSSGSLSLLMGKSAFSADRRYALPRCDAMSSLQKRVLPEPLAPITVTCRAFCSTPTSPPSMRLGSCMSILLSAFHCFAPKLHISRNITKSFSSTGHKKRLFSQGKKPLGYDRWQQPPPLEQVSQLF